MQLFSGGTEDLNYQVNTHFITRSNEEPLIYLYISTLRSTTYLVILYLYLQLFVLTYVPISTIFYESNSTNRQTVTTSHNIMAPNMFTNTEEGDTAPTSGIRPHQPDKYYSQRDFLLLGNWIFSVDQYFILTDMPIHKQGPFISTLLRDEALLWYRANYENWYPPVPLTWLTLRHAMREYFAPPNEDHRLQDEWANLKQFGTVFEYVSVLTALAMQ